MKKLKCKKSGLDITINENYNTFKRIYEEPTLNFSTGGEISLEKAEEFYQKFGEAISLLKQYKKIYDKTKEV